MKIFRILLTIFLITFIPIDCFADKNLYLAIDIIRLLLCYFMSMAIFGDKKNFVKEDSYNVKEFILISFLAIIQPLHFFASNIQEMGLLTGFLLCFAIYLYFLSIFFVCNIVIKNKNISLIWGIIVTIATLNIFYSVNLIIFASIVLMYIFSHISLQNIKKPLIVFSTVLLILNFAMVFENYSKIYLLNSKKITNTKTEQYSHQKADKNRDIYIIILDQYSGTDILKQKFNFDNSEFISELKKEGFFVFDKMYSNYNTTLASLPTMLNLELFDTKKYKSYSDAVNNAILFKMAKSNGYNTVLKNVMSFDINSKNIDYVVSGNNLLKRNECLLYFFRANLFRKYTSEYIKKQTEKHKFDFDRYDYVKGKKFVVLHVLMPHPYFWLDEKGSPQKTEFLYDFDNGYLPWLKYTNKVTIDYIHYLLKSKNKPTIIITGDHGMRDETIFDSFFSTFTAYYNPEKEYEYIKNSQSLVNVFVNFTNYEMKTNIPKQRDKIYYIQKYRSIFEDDGIIWRVNSAKDVTERYIK